MITIAPLSRLTLRGIVWDGNKANQTTPLNGIHCVGSDTFTNGGFFSFGAYILRHSGEGVYVGRRVHSGYMDPLTLIEHNDLHGVVYFETNDCKIDHSFIGHNGLSGILVQADDTNYGSNNISFEFVESYNNGRLVDPTDPTADGHGIYAKGVILQLATIRPTLQFNRCNAIRFEADSSTASRQFIVDSAFINANSWRRDQNDTIVYAEGLWSDLWTNNPGFAAIAPQHSPRAGNLPKYLVETAGLSGTVQWFGPIYDASSYLTAITNDLTKLNEISNHAIRVARGSQIRFGQSSPGDFVFFSFGANGARWQMSSDGLNYWGDGTSGATDVTFGRRSAGVVGTAAGQGLLAEVMKFYPRTSDPASGALGDMYFNSSTGKWRGCTMAGTPGTWVDIGP